MYIGQKIWKNDEDGSVSTSNTVYSWPVIDLQLTESHTKRSEGGNRTKRIEGNERAQQQR